MNRTSKSPSPKPRDGHQNSNQSSSSAASVQAHGDARDACSRDARPATRRAGAEAQRGQAGPTPETLPPPPGAKRDSRQAGPAPETLPPPGAKRDSRRSGQWSSASGSRSPAPRSCNERANPRFKVVAVRLQKFEPIGLDVNKTEGGLVIADVVPDGAAARAGIVNGQLLVSVNGEMAISMTRARCMAIISTADRAVTLTVVQVTRPQPRPPKATRAKRIRLRGTSLDLGSSSGSPTASASGPSRIRSRPGADTDSGAPPSTHRDCGSTKASPQSPAVAVVTPSVTATTPTQKTEATNATAMTETTTSTTLKRKRGVRGSYVASLSAVPLLRMCGVGAAACRPPSRGHARPADTQCMLCAKQFKHFPPDPLASPQGPSTTGATGPPFLDLNDGSTGFRELGPNFLASADKQA